MANAADFLALMRKLNTRYTDMTDDALVQHIQTFIAEQCEEDESGQGGTGSAEGGCGGGAERGGSSSARRINFSPNKKKVI